MYSFIYKSWVLAVMTLFVPLLAFAGKHGGGKHGGGHGGGGHRGGGKRGGGKHDNGHDVPEIDMAEGLAAIAIVIALLLLLREYNKRRAIA